MHRIIPLFFIICSISTMFAKGEYQNEKKIIFVGDNNPPYEYINEKGEPEGYNVDLVKEMMRRLDKDYDIKLMNLDNAVNYAKAHNNAVMMGMIHSEERAKDFCFSTPSVYVSLCIVSSGKNKYKSLEELKGKKVMVMKGSYAESAIRDALERFDIKPLLIDKAQEGFEMIKHDIGDALVVNNIIAHYTINSRNYDYFVKDIPEFSSLKYCMAAPVSNDSIIMQLNNSLAQIKAEGTYYTIYDKWINSMPEEREIPSWTKYVIYIGSALLLLTVAVAIFLLKKAKRSKMKIDEQNDRITKINEQLSLIIGNTDTGYIFLSPNLDIIWENISISKTFHYNKNYKELGCKCYSKLEDREICKKCPVRRALFTGLIEKSENMLENTPIQQTAIPIVDNEGRSKGIIMKIEDITQQKEITNELIKAKEKAEQSDHLKSAFLANVTHEFRTPLNSIIGFSSLIVDEDVHEERVKYMQIIESNTDVLLSLINDVLDLSSIESGLVIIERLEFNINDLFISIKSNIGEKLKSNSNVEFITIKPKDILMVDLDFRRTEQILTNYLTNAMKYTEKGSITLGYEVTDKDLKIYVKDTGCGIAKNKIPLLFKEFQKLNSFKQGIGLGLAISKTIAQAMGGNVGVESEVGVGSTFWVTFPKSVITDAEKMKLHYS